MKNLYVLFSIIAFYGFGQCPDQTNTFTTQAQIDQFIIDYPNCTELSGLYINGEDITNLSDCQI